MTNFQFLHTGDIHLDSPLKGLAGQDGPAADLIRTATRQAFSNLVDLAIAEEVAFVVIAGDLYDGDWRDYQTGLFFVRQMGRLAQAGIPVYLIWGNHDAESQITKRLNLPDNVKVFSSRKPQTLTLDGLKVAIHGQSFKQRDVTDNLVPAYPAPIAGCFNIGVLHTGLGGMGGHANYAPCSMDDLINKGYDYWALAHVHQGQVLHERPHVVFCGNLQGRHIRETGPKGACVVSVRDGAVDNIATIRCSVVHWARLNVAADKAHHFNDLIDAIRDAITRAVAADDGGQLLACRIQITGRTSLHAQLPGTIEQLTAEARAAALGLGEAAAWIERIAIDTEPELDRSHAVRADALGDLQKIVEDAASDGQVTAQIEAALGDLIRKLPHDLRAELESGALMDAATGDYKSLIERAGRDLLAQLEAEGA
ncbi:DNA repair exonuclease [Bradyrhizobium sp. SZCCHNR1015]|uniref:metallophosphoesterase family protein n=1 Tax=Bradyrhizobium sp. SZCCHNR1015 TaxID=3057338 RepID=UPI0029170E75|nr:DNA repair exonuclease [Bradyrhizobium sp. SZCCHNR1015]